MSNRKAQQQRDVEAVRSFCQTAKQLKVESTEEDSLTVRFTAPSGQWDYVFSFGPDYPDGTAVCCLNTHGLENMSEPLPTIIKNICSQLKLQDPVFPSVAEAISYQKQESTSSELTDASDVGDDEDIDYDEDLNGEEVLINPLLEMDIRNVERIFGENSMDYRVHNAIDEMDITFYIDMSNFLDEHTANAWGLKLEESLGILLHIRSVTKYLDGIEGQVDVFQVPPRSKLEKRKVALGSQMRKILQSFVTNQWKKLSNKMVEDAISKSKASSPQDTSGNTTGLMNKFLAAVPKPAFLRQKSLGTQIQLTAGENLDSHKDIPPLRDGFLVQFLQYALNRIKSLNEFCVICDERHVLETGLLKPCVCTRELCMFAFQTLGVMSDAAESVAKDANVVDLLIAMANAAANSSRAQLILDPYPSIVDPDHPDKMILDPKTPNFDMVKGALAKVIEIRTQLIKRKAHLSKEEMDKESKITFPLLQWIIATCRAHIIMLPDTRELKSINAKYQFLLLSSPPAKELVFRQEKEKYNGSTYAFHGSNVENWHSILRKGLINASGTKLQLHGAAYGKGVYLSPSSNVSLGYSGGTALPQGSNSNTCLAGKLRLICLALCEVVVSPALTQNGDIWLCSNADHVCTRFFFVYDSDATNKGVNFDTRLPQYKAEIDHAIGVNSMK